MEPIKTMMEYFNSCINFTPKKIKTPPAHRAGDERKKDTLLKFRLSEKAEFKKRYFALYKLIISVNKCQLKTLASIAGE